MGGFLLSTLVLLVTYGAVLTAVIQNGGNNGRNLLFSKRSLLDSDGCLLR